MLVIASTTLAFLVGNRIFWQQEYPTSLLAERLMLVIRPAVFDASGSLVGFIPATATKTDLYNAHAVVSSEIPESCVDLILRREDPRAGSWWHFLGIDLSALPHVAMHSRGGSTLSMQIARELLEPELDKVSVYRRKVIEWGIAETVQEMVAHDQRALARVYLQIAPMAKGGGGSLRGLAQFSDVVLAKPAEKMSRADCALAAVSVARNVRLDNTKAAFSRWRSRKKLAVTLLQQQYGEMAASDVAEIEGWGDMPYMRATIPNRPSSVTTNLGARTAAFVLPNLSQLQAPAAIDVEDEATP